MQTVAQAMQQFVSGLEISSCRPSAGSERCGKCTTCEARRQRDVLRAHLERQFSVKEFLISGSFARHTAIRPLNDIDLFVVLDGQTHGDLDLAPPQVVLDQLLDALDDAYPTKEKPKAQSRSVNVDFKGTGLAFDVVPAFAHGANEYRIPDRDASAWIRTNPRVHKEHGTTCNEGSGKKAKPIVKALKSWNGSLRDKAVRSFHLELMVYEALRHDPGTYADGIAHVLRAMESRVLGPMPEPAGIGPSVDDGMTVAERTQASVTFRAARELAEEANKAAKAGNTSLAHYYWRNVFGPAYPEKGKAPPQGPLATGESVASRSPDPKNRRFG